MSFVVEPNEEPLSSVQRSSDSRRFVRENKKKSWFGVLDIHTWIPVFMCITIVILVVVVLIYFMDCPQEEWSPSTYNDLTTTELADNDGIERIETAEEQEQEEAEEDEEDEENEYEQNTGEGMDSSKLTIHSDDVSNEDEEQPDELSFKEGNHIQKPKRRDMISKDGRKAQRHDVQPGEQDNYQEQQLDLRNASKTRNISESETNTTKTKSKHYNQRALQQQREMWRTQLKQANRSSYQQQQPIVNVHGLKQSETELTNTAKRPTATVLLSDNNHEKIKHPKSKVSSALTSSMSKQQGLIELEKWVKQEVQLTYQKKDYSLDACDRLWNKFKTQRTLWQVNNQDLERVITKTVKDHSQMGILNKYKMRNVMLQYKKNKGF